LYADSLLEMESNTLIAHIGTQEEIVMRPLPEITDADGEPTFLFMKQIHDEYHHLAERHRSLRVRREQIRGYEMFAKAVLRRRALIRADYAGFFFRTDIGPEHPFVAELYKRHRSGSYTSLQSAADEIMENGEA
jgi:hypothetical protein